VRTLQIEEVEAVEEATLIVEVPERDLVDSRDLVTSKVPMSLFLKMMQKSHRERLARKMTKSQRGGLVERTH